MMLDKKVPVARPNHFLEVMGAFPTIEFSYPQTKDGNRSGQPMCNYLQKQVDLFHERCFHTTIQGAMRPTIRFLAVVAIFVAVAVSTWRDTRPARNPDFREAPPSVPGPELTREIVSIHRGDTLANLLDRAGIPPEVKVKWIAAVAKELDVKKLRAGSQLTLLRSGDGILESLEYVIDPDHKLQLAKFDETLEARITEIPSIIRPDAVCGTIQGSLFESIARAGERPELAFRLAEIFAWDLDFYRDPREGDEFCVLIEKKQYSDGSPATYRSVLAAKYNNAGTIYDAYLFRDADGEPRYYSAAGQSLQSAFLRSPLEFGARVSSQFSRQRFHPILKEYRSHPGTDYAAPWGTPVRAVAAGRVLFSGLSGGYGNLITIQHANGFETQYSHLSRSLVRKGERVKQGQRIGLVGETGLATGPHLDLRVQRNGRYLNFENLKLPRESRLSAERRDSFAAVRDRFLALMATGSLSDTKIAASGTTPKAPPLAP